MLQKIENYLSRFIDSIGYLCSICLLLMIGIVFYNVIMRYFFNDASIALQELEWHLFGSILMMGIGYTLKQNGHVRVDIAHQKYTAKTKAIIEIVGHILLALPITIAIFYFSLPYVAEAYQLGESSPDPGGLPYRYLIRAVIPVAMLFLVLCLLHGIIKNAIILQQR